VAARKPTNEDIAALIEWIESGVDEPCKRSLVKGCERFGLHRTSVHEVLRTEEWADKYARACEQRGLEVAESLHDIAEKTLSGEYDHQAARVAMDALRWTSSRLLAPKRLGDKVDVTSGGERVSIAVVAEHAKDV